MHIKVQFFIPCFTCLPSCLMQPTVFLVPIFFIAAKNRRPRCPNTEHGRAQMRPPVLSCLCFSVQYSHAMSRRMVLMALFSRRDTCACDIPTSSEISVCVFPSK